jgi:hypothetical protein
VSSSGSSERGRKEKRREERREDCRDEWWEDPLELYVRGVADLSTFLKYSFISEAIVLKLPDIGVILGPAILGNKNGS